MSKEKKYILFGLALALITLLGITLAYFVSNVEGEKRSVTVSTGDLRILFNNGEKIEGIDIEPGWELTKTFSIENKTKSVYKYNLVIQNLVNTFVSDNLVYKITSTNGGYNMTDYEVLPKSDTATDTILAYSSSINGKSTQEYTISVKFKEENRNQKEDMGKVVTGKIYITKGTEGPILLSEAILRDNPTRSTRTSFSSPFNDTTTGTLFTSTESITGITDAPQEIYYYAGNTTNNWVKFGKETINGCIYNERKVNYMYDTGFKIVETSDECSSTNVCVLSDDLIPYVGFTEETCNLNGGTWTTEKATYVTEMVKDIYWRIMRTNHDGSIRLLYAGTNPSTINAYIKTSKINSLNNSPKYASYKYGEDDSTLDEIRANTTDSTIKMTLDTWYQNNLTNYTKYLSTSAVYCNDRSLGTGQTYSSTTSFSFAPYKRLYTDKTPTYNCSDIRDAFSVENTSARLTYPIALMTADEIAYAGGVIGQDMNKPYAWFAGNSNGRSITAGELIGWWLMSPAEWDSKVVRTWYSDAVYPSLNTQHTDTNSAVRPVISLNSCVKATGTGTTDDPYVVDENSSTC